VKRSLREVFLAPLHLYRWLISPNLKPRCRYYPSCSAYAVEAVRELGIFRGTIVASWRIVRCNPWSQGGVDELADRRLFAAHTHDCAEHAEHTKHEVPA
jgi:putative membrane protein insertion efficiency factor